MAITCSKCSHQTIVGGYPMDRAEQEQEKRHREIHIGTLWLQPDFRLEELTHCGDAIQQVKCNGGQMFALDSLRPVVPFAIPPSWILRTGPDASRVTTSKGQARSTLPWENSPFSSVFHSLLWGSRGPNWARDWEIRNAHYIRILSKWACFKRQVCSVCPTPVSTSPFITPER